MEGPGADLPAAVEFREGEQIREEFRPDGARPGSAPSRDSASPIPYIGACTLCLSVSKNRTASQLKI